MFKNESIPNYFILFLLFFLGSCVPNQKFIYMQDKGGVLVDSLGNMAVQKYAYKVQKGDIVYISLYSEDEKLNKVFIPTTGGMQQMGGSNGSPYYFTGFTIDQNGNVELPYIGFVHLAGSTIEQARSLLEDELRKYFKVFFLQVKMAEFKFSIFGLVNRPGQFFFQQNKVTILEAITQAGDFQNMANRLKFSCIDSSQKAQD